MSTLYIRDVPETVTEQLKQRAAAEGQSLSAYVGAQLALLVSRPTNAEIVARLRRIPRTGGATTQQILDVIAAGRR